MKEIQLTKGYVAQVSDEDYEWLNGLKWNVSVNKRGHAVVMRKKSKKYPFSYMHRMILGLTDPEIFVDHKDRNPLNNQRDNLRICNVVQNSRNSTSAKNSSSKYLGVSWRKSRNRWQVYIGLNYKKIRLGSFKNEKDAALAYNKKASQLFGEFANLNQV